MHKNFKLYILLIIIFSILLAFRSYSNDFNESHKLLPTSQDNKIISTTLIDYESLGLKKFVNYKGEKIEFSAMQYNSSLKNNNINNNAVEVNKFSIRKSFMNPVNLFFNKIYNEIYFETLSEENPNCFEGLNYLVKNNNSNCTSSSKTIYNTLNENSIFKTKGNLIGYGLGFRRENIFWSSKNIFEIGINFNVVDYKTNFDKVFNNISSDYSRDFPKNGLEWINNIRIGYFQSHPIYEGWGLGYGLTGYYNLNGGASLPVNVKSSETNIKIDALVSKKFKNNFYLSVGVEKLKRFTLGENNLIYVRDDKTFDKEKISYKINLGFIFGPKTKIYNASNITKIINDELNLSIQNKNLMSAKNKNSIKDNKKSDSNIVLYDKSKNDQNLFEFALKFAENYDLQSFN